ncbi:MAG: ATP-dependent helicase [Chloroflexota bacterium]
MALEFTPRPAQAGILEYTDGPMGVSAVPGSGKTFTLSLLASQLVERLATTGQLDDREILIVTFTNSAVANFRSRIGAFLREGQGLLAGVGYRVRTLHGLAHDIVRERPGLVGLSENFDIVDERTGNEIKRDSAIAYLRANPDALSPFIKPEYLQNFRRIERYVIDDAIDIANSVIRVAKDLTVPPHVLQATLRQQSGSWPLLDFGLHVYTDYQRSLFVRGAVDFDDLIGLALQSLETDQDFLARLQTRWPYVLEDEAQDSSRLQERMLRFLTNDNGNWVRVGDPNQAINTTFTSADPQFLRSFVTRYSEQSRNLPNSGRSALPIINAANHLIEWSRTQHPLIPPEKALAPPFIEPTPPGDPQPNPEPGNPAVYLFDRPLNPDEEINVVLTSLQRWLRTNQDKTVAILVPENNRGFRMAEALNRIGTPFDDSLLRSDNTTRTTAQALSTILSYVTLPHQPTHLERLWLNVWWPRRGVRVASTLQSAILNPELPEVTAEQDINELPSPDKLPEPVEIFGRALRKLTEPESFLFPSNKDWLDTLSWMDETPGFRTVVDAFRADLRRWTAATVLPVDELLLTLGNAIFAKPADLALTHRLAVLLSKLGQENPLWRLPELAGELDNIAQNRRRILGFNEEGLGFEPKPGQVTVATMHASKGLEWDRVFLTAVNDFSFPSGSETEKYRGERWYIRDNMNLLAESIAQIKQLHMGSLDDYQVGEATMEGRIDLGAERLRLLYVGVTRARRELILTYNTGRNPERDPNEPALAFRALQRVN